MIVKRAYLEDKEGVSWYRRGRFVITKKAFLEGKEGVSWYRRRRFFNFKGCRIKR